MAILSGQYEPELKTIQLGQKYLIEASRYSNIGFVNRIKSIEVLEDKKYTLKELITIIRNAFTIDGKYIKLRITFDDETIVVEKRYLLSRNSGLKATVTIHYNAEYWVKPEPIAPPSGQLFFMDYVGLKK